MISINIPQMLVLCPSNVRLSRSSSLDYSSRRSSPGLALSVTVDWLCFCFGTTLKYWRRTAGLDRRRVLNDPCGASLMFGCVDTNSGAVSQLCSAWEINQETVAEWIAAVHEESVTVLCVRSYLRGVEGCRCRCCTVASKHMCRGRTCTAVTLSPLRMVGKSGSSAIQGSYRRVLQQTQ